MEHVRVEEVDEGKTFVKKKKEDNSYTEECSTVVGQRDDGVW